MRTDQSGGHTVTLLSGENAAGKAGFERMAVHHSGNCVNNHPGENSGGLLVSGSRAPQRVIENAGFRFRLQAQCNGEYPATSAVGSQPFGVTL